MEYVSFSTEEKAKLFDEISACFYHANFGQMAKSDIELLMFRFYMDKLISDSTTADGTIDYHKCSDYRISKDLGITQQRVRNLKVKKQLVYPTDFDWKSALAKLTEHGRYDPKTGKVTLNIPDPNLYLEIQNFIEEKGAYVEKQLNSKILQLRAEYYIDLIVALEPEESRDKLIKRLKTEFKDSGKEDVVFDERNIGRSLLEAAVNVSALAANISGAVSPSNMVGAALIKLLTR